MATVHSKSRADQVRSMRKQDQLAISFSVLWNFKRVWWPANHHTIELKNSGLPQNSLHDSRSKTGLHVSADQSFSLSRMSFIMNLDRSRSVKQGSKLFSPVFAIFSVDFQRTCCLRYRDLPMMDAGDASVLDYRVEKTLCQSLWGYANQLLMDWSTLFAVEKHKTFPKLNSYLGHIGPSKWEEVCPQSMEKKNPFKTFCEFDCAKN